MINPLKSLRGLVDILPIETDRWHAVESEAYEIFRRSGFKEIRTPILETTNLFSRSIGEDTDVVGKEMYTFQDRGERSCTMRPEGTASVVRAILQHGLITKGPQRLWYKGPMFRYERPQAGRQRQFHQIGVECFGIESTRSDAELISLAWDFLQQLGLEDLTLEINTLGSFKDRKKYIAEFVAWLEARKQYLDSDSQNRLQTNPLRILDSKNPTTQEVLREAPMLYNYLCDESRLRFEEIKNILKALEIPIKVNDRLVRGLDYYCHTAFEITSTKLGSQATVCGGGRYDYLIEQLGGPPTPAIGWAIGMERLMMLFESSQSNPPPEVYLVNRGELAENQSLVIARKLRYLGLHVELDCSGASFGKQFKRADRSRAPWAMVLGDEEVKRGELRLKRLRSGTDDKINSELIVSLSDMNGLIEILRER